MSRSQILARLRESVDKTDPTELPQGLPSFPSYQNRQEKFCQELERVVGRCLDGRPDGALSLALESVLKESQASSILWENQQVLDKHGIPYEEGRGPNEEGEILLKSAHPDQRVSFPLKLEIEPYKRSTLRKLTISISSAICGIAETGTIVELGGNHRSRVLPMITPFHVALLSEKDILQNPAQFFESVRSRDEDYSYCTLMTGPSRTGDIESTLVLGVHGPQSVFAILTV